MHNHFLTQQFEAWRERPLLTHYRLLSKIVQELLGHSQISMTLDTYSHILPSLQEEAVNRLNTLFENKENPVAVTVAVNLDHTNRKKKGKPGLT